MATEQPLYSKADEAKWTAIGESLDEAAIGAIDRMMQRLAAHHPDSAAHSERVAENTRKSAETLGINSVAAKAIWQAARLHDAGKEIVPVEILSKPGRLTERETDIILGHPEAGALIVSAEPGLPAEFRDLAIDGTMGHQEKFDGTGYPREFKGDAISFIGRLIKPADTFDSVAYRGGYCQALGPTETLRQMQDDLNERMRGQFQPALLKNFVKTIETLESAIPLSHLLVNQRNSTPICQPQ